MTEPTSSKRSLFWDGIVSLFLALFCGYLVERMTPSIGLLTALAIVLSSIAFIFWFISRRPTAMLLKSNLPIAAFWWLGIYLGIYWLPMAPVKAINATLPVLFLSQFAQLPEQLSDRKA